MIVDGTVFVTSGFRGAALLAIRLSDARGDITGSDAISWSLDKDTPYTPSPLVHDGTIYILKTNTAILSSFDARTGKEHYRGQRLEGLGNIYSSPVGVGDRFYVHRPGRQHASWSATARSSRSWPPTLSTMVSTLPWPSWATRSSSAVQKHLYSIAGSD